MSQPRHNVSVLLPPPPRVPSFGQPTTLFVSPTADVQSATMRPRGGK